MIQNFEFKVKVESISLYEKMLQEKGAHFHGIDHQIDTYFNAPAGRLKLREGNIENALISYDRQDRHGAKLSEIELFSFSGDPALKKILAKQFGIKVVVDKIRKIYFIDNVKFHFDRVDGLGEFVEVEAIDTTGKGSLAGLQNQCDYYFNFFGFTDSMTVASSYSDLLR